MSKKLAAGLDALVLDIKTGSGAFLRDPQQARFLAELMVETGERSGTRTVALLTDMSQPLGSAAGNWIEIAEVRTLLQAERPALSEDLRTVSLELAAWMLFLGGADASLDSGRARADRLLADGSAWQSFQAIVEAQGGDLRVLDKPATHHKPGATGVFRAAHSGFLSSMDTTAVGWAVQRLGAGRANAGEPVDPHAGLTMHAKLGEQVKEGEALCTLFATDRDHLEAGLELLKGTVTITEESITPPALIGECISRSN
jgi:pyrimidine-nucleoside phosphorylase